MSESINKAGPRILHVTTVPQTLSFLAGHIAHARDRGFDVQVATSPGDTLEAFQRETQINSHPIAMSRRITPFGDLGSLWCMVRLMRKLRPMLVNGHTPKGGLLAMMAATMCRVPVRVYHMHGLPLLTATGMKRRLLRWSERTSCRLAHQVLCISDSLREVAIAEGLCPANKIKVLNHGNIDGVEAEAKFNPARLSADRAREVRVRYQIPQDALVAGFVGRIVRDKGLIELVRAWQNLREEFASLHLLIAGPFEDQDPIPADVEAVLRSDPRVHLAGWVPVRDMPSVYRVLDILVLPTYREGFGTVLLEASAMELPVVATRIPGVLDAVRDGETGLLVPAQDAEALASAVGRYLRDVDLRRQHGRAGRERVLRDFDPQVMHETLFAEYVRLLQDRNVRDCHELSGVA